MSEIINVKAAGLGGQGVLKATDILAEAAFEAGYDVKKSEVHGMSQRGGSVSSDVRYGKHVASPMIPDKEVAYLLVLEPTQLAVNAASLAPDAVVIGAEEVGEIENPKALNIALLGKLSKYLQIPREAWVAAIKKFLPEKLHELNLRIFDAAAK